MDILPWPTVFASSGKKYTEKEKHRQSISSKNYKIMKIILSMSAEKQLDLFLTEIFA